MAAYFNVNILKQKGGRQRILDRIAKAGTPSILNLYLEGVMWLEYICHDVAYSILIHLFKNVK
jgi:hypothetical protein